MTHSCSSFLRAARLIGAAFVAGVLSAFTKSGAEVLLPPRLPGQTPPPVEVLHRLGLDPQAMVYRFSEHLVNWGGNGVHIVFSVVIALVYCLLVERSARFRVWHGLPFGLIVAFGAHAIVLPLLFGGGLWHAGLDGWLSELITSSIWIWTMEALRRNLLGWRV